MLDDIISHSALGENTLPVRISGSNDYLQTSYTISESLAYVTFDDKSALCTEYYEHQTFTVPEGLKLVEHYYASYASYKAGTVDRTEQKEIPSGLFDGCQKVIDAGAVQSFKNQTSLLSLPNLTTVAYDGSVSIYSLKIMDINAKPLELYITGETADIGSSWYGNGVNQRVSKVYVCSGTNFSVYAGALSYTGQVIKEENGASIDKWWL